MNQTQALAKLKKALGPKFGYRVNPKAPSAEEREESRARLAIVKAETDAAEKAMLARQAELLKDPDYQAAAARFRALREEGSRLTSRSYSKRITVGITGAMFFSVKADGDNWDEVVNKVINGD